MGKTTLHSPTLNTVLMVEETLKNAKEVVPIAKLKTLLPKKVMHQTLLHIIDYLQSSGKVILGTKGVLWVFEEDKILGSLIQKGIEV